MITFRILDMDIEQIQDECLIIHLCGRTENDKTVYCKVLGYEPYMFLELPVDINWTGAKVQALADYIKTKLQECPPEMIRFEIKKLCLYSVTRPFLRINFKTEDSWRHLKNLLKYTWRVPGFSREFPSGSFKLHEQKFPTLVKFGIERKLDMSGWVTVKILEKRDKEKYPDNFSTCDYNIYTKANWVSKAITPSSDILVDPLILSYDIELHSDNRKSSSPDPSNPKNVIPMISLVYGKLSLPLEDWKAYVITQYVGNEKLDGKYKAEVIDCKGSETRLLANFCKIVKRISPDIITGYNINGFDWGAMLKRAEINGIQERFFKLGRLKWQRDKLKDMSWTSNARGKQEIMYVKLAGIFNFDLFPEIRFNHSLPTYKLATVAKHFLGEQEKKEDMPYQQMFALFDMIEVLERSLENGVIMNYKLAKKLIISKTTPAELLSVPGMTNHVADFYSELKNTHDLQDVVFVARSFMQRMLKYVIQDARIVPALIKFLNSLTSLWENSIISRCPPNFIYEQGQQIKVMAQYLEKAYTRNFVVPHYEKAKNDNYDGNEEEEDDGKKNYQGATVLKVKRGLYKNIATLDFASLYPSIMRAYNICHTQLVPPEVQIPDEECNIAQWSEHIRCEHDPEKRQKKKGEKAFCGNHYYRWRKHHGKEELKGLLPLLLDELGNARNKVKKDLAVKQKKWNEYKVRFNVLTEEEKKDMDLVYRLSTVLDARQLALKVSANSCVANTEIPILINGKFQYPKISKLGKYIKWIQRNDYEIGLFNIDVMVWTEKGFTKVNYIFKHWIDEDVCKVETENGSFITVTQDHSLLDEYGNSVSAKNLVIGNRLLHKKLPFATNIDDTKNKITNMQWIKYTGWVYDLETENHHFAAGKGSLIVHNSSYGTLGAIKGYAPLIEGAASVTYYGREAIHKTIKIIEERWPTAEVIYGDSVSADTPVILQVDGKIKVYEIQNLVSKDVWRAEYKWFSGIVKEYCDIAENDRFSIWTDQGWCKIHRIIRHKAHGKRMFRVTSHFGSVDVSEDHSLLDRDRWQIKPGNLKIGKTELLYRDPYNRYLFDDSNIVYKCKSKTEAMKYMLNRPTLTCIEYVDEEYIIRSTLEQCNIVTSVVELSNCDEYIYDIETENGRFHAGPGFLIVKNTDSVFVNFHVDDLKMIFQLQREAEKFVTSNFPPEMKIAADNMYGVLLLLTKKRYEYKIVNEDGIVLKEGSKGSINKRRDNCDVAREIYSYCLELTMKGVSQDQTLFELNNKILDMYRGLCPLQDFIIYKGLKQLVEEYKNCAGHVLFAKRLEERGNVMKAGTRLEYVFIKKRGKDLKSGMRMEDWSFFLMNRYKDNLQIDYGYYLEHNIMVPVTEVLNIAFPVTEKQFYLPEDNFKRAMEIYLKPGWKDYLNGWSLEKKARYIGAHSKKKVLREAAQVFYARVVLDKLYKQHGLKKRAYHKPKRGSNVIFLNDRVIEQIHSYHNFWQDVIWQILDRRNIPDWILAKYWEK